MRAQHLALVQAQADPDPRSHLARGELGPGRAFLLPLRLVEVVVVERRVRESSEKEPALRSSRAHRGLHCLTYATVEVCQMPTWSSLALGKTSWSACVSSAERADGEQSRRQVGHEQYTIYIMQNLLKRVLYQAKEDGPLSNTGRLLRVSKRLHRLL